MNVPSSTFIAIFWGVITAGILYLFLKSFNKKKDKK